MDYKITGYEPAQLFHFFEEVSAIPRGSGNEKGISDFLVALAKERGLDVYQDEVCRCRECPDRDAAGSYRHGVRQAGLR